ncbi:vacuolar protein sorting-associated protein 26A isoform X2 [Gossypium hirsutum]|uniref:Vacuolar protein sorting-associated protein 26A isoform X2 n=1 Tax=Gossypium hirsutum TaxID=3635 RepID=A0ABM3AGU3_GOSHI|nr:vacuolar protein sorting-associated protein 26A-like isoform X2 [Gossypium hirsutum]
MNFLIGAFKPACNISITFSDGKSRKQVPMKKENGKTIMVSLFQSKESIAGKVSIEPLQGKKIEHLGVKVELLGQIEMYFDRGNFYDFTSLVRELDVPGDIYERKTYPFEFSTVEMPYETYNGANLRLRYVLKVTVSRNYGGSIVEYQDFMCCDCSNLSFAWLMCMRFEIILHLRQSTIASKWKLELKIACTLSLSIIKASESIPIRLFLSPYELTPTYRNINNKFSVKYYLNLVLVDEEDRRYFKQQEIAIYRQQDS